MSETRPLGAQEPASARHRSLSGHVRIPGDKSISHRALILAAMATGKSCISGLLEAEDVLATAEAMRDLGADIVKTETACPQNQWTVHGVGPGGLKRPSKALDFGNSGTGARLVMGVIAGAAIEAQFIGDASLSVRPMARITEPLAQMGVQIDKVEKDQDTHLPLTLRGASMPMPIDYAPPMASAQVKSAILLAGLGAPGTTIVREAHITRDHSETMLALFGAQIDRHMEGSTHIVELIGPAKLTGTDIIVPGDPSSAAFPMVAALLVPGSDVVLENIMVNPQRDGLIRVLRQMGGDIELFNERHAAGEKIADMRVRHSKLKGVSVAAKTAPSMIDEYPALAVAAATAEGVTHMHGLGELRVKESDRLAAIADALAANGVQVKASKDDLRITGGPIAGGGLVATHHDHRIAMAFLVLGLVGEAPIKVDTTDMIATSFPQFFDLMAELGANFEV